MNPYAAHYLALLRSRELIAEADRDRLIHRVAIARRARRRAAAAPPTETVIDITDTAATAAVPPPPDPTAKRPEPVA